MNTLLDGKSQSIQGRNSNSARGVAVSEKHSLALLGFFTVSGLLYVLGAVFTTMLTAHAVRDIWLALTITLFAGMVVGVTLFFLSYKSSATRITNSR
jgi:hypothetical protein